MQLYREMITRGEPTQVSAMMDEIERRLPEGWKRDREYEVSYREREASSRRIYVFKSEGIDGLPAVTVFLPEREPGTEFGSIVFPPGMSRLSSEPNNAVIERFFTEFARPCAGATGASVELTPDRFDERHWLSEAAVEKLHLFNRLANKGLGGALPADHERWIDFVVTAHRDRTDLPAHMLRNWLVEDGGWDFDDADRLAGKYSFGNEVLSYVESQPA